MSSSQPITACVRKENTANILYMKRASVQSYPGFDFYLLMNTKEHRRLDHSVLPRNIYDFMMTI